MMLTAEQEMAYLRAVVPMLKDYLGSHEIAWPLPTITADGSQPYSLLTPGPLLFMLKRLKARGLTGSLLEELGRHEEQIFQEQIHNETAWKKKVGQDLSSRARLWQQVLDDYRSDQQAVVTAYPASVAQRVMLQLLWEEIESTGILVAPLKFTLEFMDVTLRTIFQRGKFVWEQALQTGFPESIYWYLYGTLINKASVK